MEIIEQSNINSDIGIYPHLFIFLGFIFAHLLLLLLSVPYVLTRPSLCNAVKAGSQHCSRKSENNLDLIFFAFRGICIMFRYIRIFEYIFRIHDKICKQTFSNRHQHQDKSKQI